MDLLGQEDVDEFRSAMRDVTDTFHKSPVVLRRADGSELPLLAGKTPVSDSSEEKESGNLVVQDPQSDQVERWLITFNREYLQEQGLIEDGVLLITLEDWIVIGGHRFAIVGISDRAIFRGEPILVKLTVAR